WRWGPVARRVPPPKWESGLIGPSNSTAGSAHGHAVHLDGGDAHAHRHALSFFAAGADALIELQVVAHHGDFGQRVGPVADKRGVAQRRGDLSVFDQVSFARRENEFSAGDVHLPAAKIRRKHAALHAADNVFGRV